MEIRHAKENDIEEMMRIYAFARTFMEEHGNPRQWGVRCWPPRELILQDIQEEKSYVCVDEEEICGVFFFDKGTQIEPSYDVIEEGAWIGEDHYGVVHRIASDGSRRGIGSFCLNWAYEQCGHLRIDTHPDNKVMQKLLTKLGFAYCGVVHVPEEEDDIRWGYEKI